MLLHRAITTKEKKKNTQQTPNPAAQVPSALPPSVLHSLEVSQVPERFFKQIRKDFRRGGRWSLSNFIT